MSKFVEKSDLDNSELTNLPIRRGCGGICACIGTCKNIVGYVKREEYVEFMKTYMALSTFLDLKALQCPKKTS